MKRFLEVAVLSAVLLSAPPSPAITWTLVESSAVHLRWPNEANSANGFETAPGLLGRVVSHTSENTLNACELAESHPCGIDEPPGIFGFFPAEGPENEPLGEDNAECNRKVNGCGTGLIPGAHTGHPGSAVPNETSIGEYSYFVLHRTGGAKSMAFISGTYVTTQSAYQCNGCPPAGAGRDVANALSLTNPKIMADVTTNSVSLWTTQFVDGFGRTGHSALTLAASTAGAVSACGNGLQFETLTMDICEDTTSYPIPLKWNVTTYSVSAAQHASQTGADRCDGPDCYVRQVIIPAALTQSANAKSVQVREASTVLPATSPFSLDNATLDIILFAFTTQALDSDADGAEDRVDPCPSDASNFCVMNIFGAGACPAGQVFCPDTLGALGCREPYLCNARLDPNQDCSVNGADFLRIAGESDGGPEPDGNEAFGTGLPIGPFDP